MTPTVSVRARARLAVRTLVPAMLAIAVAFASPLVFDSSKVLSPAFEPAHAVDASSHNWRVSEASWYGPGFHGRGTACGQVMSPDLQGVAHKSLPCGTLVRFEWHGTEVVVPVVDRGPYVRDREWDLTQATCEKLGRCHTAAVAWTL